jgi:predicted TIM-barrel fold metal-dependent hydrolase
MEAGAGWVPFMLERLDREAKNRGAGLRSKPSQQLRSERIFFHCELDEQMLPVAVDVLGAEHFVCASDFPHEPTSEFIESVAAFRARTDVSDRAKAQILYDNPKRLYRL